MIHAEQDVVDFAALRTLRQQGLVVDARRSVPIYPNPAEPERHGKDGNRYGRSSIHALVRSGHRFHARRHGAVAAAQNEVWTDEACIRVEHQPVLSACAAHCLSSFLYFSWVERVIALAKTSLSSSGRTGKR